MTVSFYLSRPKSTSATTIFARISYHGQSLKYYTSESINPRNWNSNLKRAKKGDHFKEYPEFNARIEHFQVTIKNTYRKWVNDNNGVEPSPSTLKNLLDQALKSKEIIADPKKTLIGFFEDLINRTERGQRLQPTSGQPYSKSTLQVYRNTLNRLRKFSLVSGQIVDFKDITLEFYSNFLTFLTQTENLATNTIGKDIKTLKVVLNEATEHGINSSLQFKFRKFAVPREDTDAIYLTSQELQEMESMDLTDRPTLDRVRDLFLIGCYSGLRFSDFSTLTESNISDGMIRVTAIKTGSPVTIPVHPTIAVIIKKYGGKIPRSVSNQKTNEYLKEIGEQMDCLQFPIERAITKGGKKIVTNSAKWEQISTHTARRSFATNEYLAGTQTLTIMAITGHKTEKAFLRYIKLSSTEHAKKLQMIWAERHVLRAV